MAPTGAGTTVATTEYRLSPNGPLLGTGNYVMGFLQAARVLLRASPPASWCGRNPAVAPKNHRRRLVSRSGHIAIAIIPALEMRRGLKGASRCKSRKRWKLLKGR